LSAHVIQLPAEQLNEIFHGRAEAQIDASRRALTNYSVGKVEENCNATGDVMAALG
jgi:hypothetical protein